MISERLHDHWAAGYLPLAREAMPVQSYREEVLSGKAMDPVNTIYAATMAWPNEELHALANPIRRAAVSVPSNPCGG